MNPQQLLRDYIVKYWENISIYGGLFVVLTTALVWRLNSLVYGYSAGEAQTYFMSHNLRQLLNNPINAPYFILVRILSYLTPHSYLATRITSVILGLIILILFALVLHKWQGRYVAVIGTLLFGLSAWFLHTARLGTPDVLYFGVFALAAGGYWLKLTRDRGALALCFAATIVLLYAPGMLWFILVGLFWQRKAVFITFRRHSITASIAGTILLLATVPIAWAFYHHHNVILPFLALPTNWPAPLTIVENLYKIPYNFFVHAQVNPVTWLGSAPILDAFSTAMLVLGSYLYLQYVKLTRMQLFSSILILTIVLMAIGSPITFSIIIPSVYLAIAAGVAYLVDIWFNVFPRNPIAAGVAWTLLTALIGAVCLYHLTHYFIGWPQAQATQAAFIQTKPN